MNIFRFFYLTCTVVYIVSIIAGNCSRTSNPNHRFRSLHNERPVAMRSQSDNDQPQSVRGPVTPEQPLISEAKLLEELQKKFTNVDPILPPNSRPIIVTSSIRVLNNPRISEEDQTLNGNFEVKQSWTDERFQLDLPRTVQLSQDYQQLIWNPKTIVTNAFAVQVKSMYMARGRIQVDTTNGKITQTLYLHTKTNCLLDLTNYPYDWQQCVIQFGSAVYNSASLEYRWASTLSSTDGRIPVEFSPEALAPNSEFRYEGYIAKHDSIGFGNNTEKFSGLEIKFYLSRSSLFPFFAFILSFSMLVFLGLLPPFLSPETLIGRITIAATTFVGSLGLLYWRPMGPTVVLPHLSALDVYAGLSMLLSIASLVESCIVGSIISKYQGNGDNGKEQSQPSGRRGQERLGSEVDTVVHFNPPLSVRSPGRGRVQVSAISRQERNYVPEFEEVTRNEEKEVRMNRARRIDSITKIVYAIVACGSILVIHLCYRTTKESLADFQRVDAH